jgi:hypothetical protein
MAPKLFRQNGFRGHTGLRDSVEILWTEELSRFQFPNNNEST